MQQQLRSVVESRCGSVYAVTAMLAPVSEPELFGKTISSTQFIAIADRVQRSCGTAFAIDADGFLLTNEHVINGATSVWVTDDQGRTLPALVVGTDPRGDLAVLRIPARTTPIEFAQPLAVESAESVARRGDLVLTLGNPGGSSIAGQMAASAGIISATGRALPTLSAREHRFYSDLLQITTPITTGNSGGPLLDLSGRAVGMVCAVAASDPTQQNVGFAITLSPSVQSRIAQLKRGEETTYGFLGVNVSQAELTAPSIPSRQPVAFVQPALTPAPAPSEPAPTTGGALIDHVDAGTPAFGILRTGDIVLRFDGTAIRSDMDFIRIAGACDVERDVPLTIVRDGATLELTIRPRRRALPIDPVTFATQSFRWAGVTFANGVQGVSVTEVAPGAATPLKAGSVLSTINGQPVTNLIDLLEVLHARAGEALEIELLPPE